MVDIVPKSNVRQLRHAGGRRTSKGYDPSTGEESRARGTRAESDVLALNDDHSYRIDRFYTRSVDANGHGEKLNLRVPQGIDSQMYKAVSEVPEYRTLQDLVRDAVMHRLEYLQKQYDLGEKARIMLERERQKADRAQRMQDSDEMEAIVVEMEAALSMFYARNDWSLLKEELETSADSVDWLRGEYKKRAEEIVKKWRDKSRDQIRKMMKDRDE